MSQAEIAQSLGLSPAMITKLKKRGMPVSTVEAAQAWRRQNVNPYTKASAPPPSPLPRAPDAAPSDGAPLDLSQERAMLAREQRVQLEMKTAVMRGEYAPISLLAEVLANASQAVAERFDRLPGRVRQRCPTLPAAALDQVLAVVAEARNEWVTLTVALVRAKIVTSDDDLSDDVAAAAEDGPP